MNTIFGINSVSSFQFSIITIDLSDLIQILKIKKSKYDVSLKLKNGVSVQIIPFVIHNECKPIKIAT